MAKDKLKVKEKIGKKNTSLRLDNKTLKALKIKAIEQDLSVQAVLEKLVEGYLSGRFIVARQQTDDGDTE